MSTTNTSTNDQSKTTGANPGTPNPAGPAAPPTGPAPVPAEPADVAAPLLSKLEALTAQIGKASAAVERLERSRRVEQLLRGARVTDLESAAALVEQALGESQGKLDPERAVANLRASRPGLFRSGGASPVSSAMSPRADVGAAGASTAAAEDADPARIAQRLAAGDHRAILAFMRARRGA